MAVIAVFGSKGGVGASLVSVNLGLRLAEEAPTLLVDLVTGAGCCDLLLDVSAERSWRELLPVADELTDRHLELSVVHHESGLSLLAAPRAQEPAPEGLGALLAVLASRWSWVVLDAGSGCVAPRRVALEVADRALLVATPDPPALRAAKRWVEVIQEEEGQSEPDFVLNQLSSGHPVSPERTARSLGIDLLGAIPLDRLSVAPQVHFGIPPSQPSESGLGAAIRNLAGAVLRGQAGRVEGRERTVGGVADGA